MLETVIPERHRDRFKSTRNGSRVKLGRCPICGDRVRKGHDYLTTSEGYTHSDCLEKWRSD